MAKRSFLGNTNPAMSRIGSVVEERNFDTSFENKMTLSGTVNKSLMLVGILFIAATITWNLAETAPDRAFALMLGGGIGGLIVALVIIFKQELAPKLAWLYAALEGLFIGAISYNYNFAFEGIVLQAVGLTMCTLALMLVLYRFEIIKVTEKFRSIIIAATGGIFVMYMVVFVANLFGAGLSFIHDGGMISIGISLFVVTIAALNLLLDFDMIEKGVEGNAPKYYEWYAGFSLLVTLVWLYLEILRLLSYFSED
jgi:uncharacterized YccA/Bax inhibitor family protein